MTQKTFVRLLCAIIVIVILLPTVIACKKEEIPEESDSQDVSNSQESDGNAPTPYMDDFGGYEFKVLTRKGGTYESNDITAGLDIGAKAVHPRQNQINLLPDYVKICHEKGIRVHTWTVNTEEDFHFLINAGVDAIITNYPDIGLKVRNEI